jgi:predicted RNA-binding protein YlxR (DUF448 family)
MIDTREFRTRKDGVKLYRTVDALTDDETGKVILDKDGNAVMRGFYILQNETNIEYAEAIDVENAPYTYSETDKPIPTEPSEEEATEQGYLNALNESGVKTDEESNA